jgi:hypothetical protein
MTYSDVVIGEDQRTVDYTLRINVRDLGEPLGGDSEHIPSIAEIEAGTSRLYTYVLERVEVETNAAACATTRAGITFIEQGERFAQLAWHLACPRPFTSFAIEYHLFFDLDELHTGNLRVRLRDETAVTPIQTGARRFEWNDLAGAPPSGAWAFLRLGVEHILTGYDHVCFVIALLLVAVIARPRGRSWETRGVLGSLRYTAGIVTAFTLAHSITLVSAALGFVSVPSLLVEAVIALSIIFVAVENMAWPEARYRWALAFGFGLVHGLGFASVLADLLPPGETLVPLLTFNLGVELGQLGIVLVVVPVLHVLSSRILGASDYRRFAVTAGSLVIAGLGTTWFIERVFDVPIL